MKNSKILSGLFLAVLCTTAISIAETYTTTTSTTKYTRPVTTRTVTTTTSPTAVTSKTIDATTNPMYSVNRNDKIQQYQGTTTSTPSTTTTTKYTRPVTTRTVTTTTSPTTVKSTTIDATTNPMYSVNRNDKIQQYQGSNYSTPKTTTTTTQYSRPTTTRTTTTSNTSAVKSTGNQSREQQILNDLQSQAQSELNYYQKLMTCTPSTMVNGNLELKTYGMSNGLCGFDIKALNPKTNQMTTLCTFNVPAESAKKFASDKLRYERSLLGMEQLTTEEYTEITTNLTLFTKENCKQAK